MTRGELIRLAFLILSLAVLVAMGLATTAAIA
jgi:uncharacterized protein (UPF0333 family)